MIPTPITYVVATEFGEIALQVVDIWIERSTGGKGQGRSGCRFRRSIIRTHFWGGGRKGFLLSGRDNCDRNNREIDPTCLGERKRLTEAPGHSAGFSTIRRVLSHALSP